MTADHPQQSTNVASRTSNAHDWSTQGDWARVKVNVSQWGTEPVVRISRPSRRCQSVPGSLKSPALAAGQDNAQDDGKDQVDRSGYETAGASPC